MRLVVLRSAVTACTAAVCFWPLLACFEARAQGGKAAERMMTCLERATSPGFRITDDVEPRMLPGYATDLADFAAGFIREWDAPPAIVLENVGEIRAATVATLELPVLPPLATLQAVCAQYGFVVELDEARRTLFVGSLTRRWGDREKAWPALLAAGKEAVEQEKDLGKLSYLLASMLAFPKKGVKELISLTWAKRPEVQFIALNVLMARPGMHNYRKVFQPFLRKGDANVRVAAARLLFARCEPVRVGGLFRKLGSVAPGRPDFERWNLKAFVPYFLPCLREGVRFHREHAPLLYTLKELYEWQPDVIAAVRGEIARLGLKPSDAVVPRPGPPAPAALDLAAYLEGASDPYDGRTSGTRFAVPSGRMPLGMLMREGAKGLLRAAELTMPDLTGEHPLVETFPHPLVGKVAMLQAYAGRHGFVLRYETYGKRLTVRSIEKAWGPRKEVWPKVRSKCRELARAEEDMGKLAYLLAVLPGFGEEGMTELLDCAVHERSVVRFLALSVLENAPAVEPARIARSLLDPDEHVRYAAMRVLLIRADPALAGKAIRAATGRGSLRSSEWYDLVRAAMQRCIRDHALGSWPRMLPLLEELRSIFAEDKEIAAYVEKMIGYAMPRPR